MGRIYSTEDEDLMQNIDEEIDHRDRQIPADIVPQCLSTLKNKFIISKNVENLLKQSSRFSTSFHQKDFAKKH